jgi:exosome complex component RRP4
MTKKEIIVPGEIIAEGEDFLPGDWTIKQKNNIISTRLGIIEKSDRIIKVIPISGVYMPRRGNTVIGEIKDITMAGWNVDIGGPYSSFLPLRECPGFIEESEMENVYGIGDLIVTRVHNVRRTNIDLTMKSRDRDLIKLKEGIIMRISAHRVPRVIGKEGSMISLIKENTKCSIIVGQNGLIWISGDNIQNELKAKKAIEFINENIIVEGLTEKVEGWFKEYKEK